MHTANLQHMVHASLLAAMTAVGAYIIIPVGPVPIVLQNLFVLLSGLLLGSRWGFLSMAIYFMLGAIGIPVFAGGKGGIGHILGPTGGYIFGFAVCAFLTGFISERNRGKSRLSDALAVFAGSLTIYACGVPWLKVVTGFSWLKALSVGMLPFLPGDIIKAAAAVVLARTIRPLLSRHMELARR